jgi:phosphomannomutase
VTNLSTSRMLDDVAAAHGARVVRTPVGEANVVQAMKELGDQCLVGGEGNGGVIWPRVTYVRDSLSAMGLVLALIQSRGQPLSKIVDAMPAYAIRKRKVNVKGPEDAQRAVAAVAAMFQKAGATVDRRDGAWVDLVSRRAWLHVRPSNTEPIVRLIAEAPAAREADALLDQAHSAIGPA